MPADLRAVYTATLREGGDPPSPECLEYVFRLIFRASFQGKGFRDLPAAELCGIFRDRAAADFGSFADQAMAAFGLRTYRDLGRVVFLMAEKGCLTLKEGESLEDYAAAGPIRFGPA